MLTIAVDAMGGDQLPRNPKSSGRYRPRGRSGVEVILVGREDVVGASWSSTTAGATCPSKSVHASEHITMDDSAAKAVRPRRTAPCASPPGWCAKGVAHGFVSAGNTGAVMATAKMVQGVVPGVDRPALARRLPDPGRHSGGDGGCGRECRLRPEMLAQFAVMGDIYSRIILQHEKPKVGLLSIGEEEHKGNELTQAATPMLKACRRQFHRQRGRPRPVYTGNADVIVCDGFIGNVALKVSEGLVDVIKQMLQESLEATITRQDRIRALPRALSTISRSAWITPNIGGAPLLGVKGVCIICHGRRTSTRSRTRFASHPSSPAGKSIRRSKKN